MKYSTLGNFCEIRMGHSPPSEQASNADGGVPFLRTHAEFGEDYPAPSAYTTEPTVIATEGDILFSPHGEVGKINKCDQDYCIGFQIARLRPREGLLDDGFLWHWLKFARKQIMLKAAGKEHVTVSELNRLPMFVPESMQEQQKVAEILDKADEICQKRIQAINMVEELHRSYFLTTFGDPGLAPTEESVPLGKLCHISMKIISPRDYTLESASKRKAQESKVAEPQAGYNAKLDNRINRNRDYVAESSANYNARQGNAANIQQWQVAEPAKSYNAETDSKPESTSRISPIVNAHASQDLESRDRHLLYPGDVALPANRLGAAVVVPEHYNGTVPESMIAASPREGLISPIYLRDLLNSSGGRYLLMNRVKNRRVIRLDPGIFQDLSIPAPPIAEQEQYSSSVKQLAESRDQLIQAYQGSEAIYRSLSQNLFNRQSETTP